MTDRTNIEQAPSTPPRAVRASVVVWTTGVGLVVLNATALVLAGNSLPFNRPVFAGVPVVTQVLQGWSYLLGAAMLIGITYLVTRKRTVPDMAARAPARRRARAEVGLIAGYVVVAQAGGFILGHLIGHHAISLHVPSVLFGITDPPNASWVYAWASYNFVVYAVLPYVYFRRRGYTNEQLNLHSADRRADLKLILIILTVETVIELSVLGKDLFALGPALAARAIGISFVINFFGTVLPIAILIYGILLPRVLRITGSSAATVVIAGLAYALVHLFDAWTNYGSVRATVLSVIFLIMQYFGPGMIKAVLTLRTGNTWVHVWSYHAIAPHATIDAPSIVKPLHLH